MAKKSVKKASAKTKARAAKAKAKVRAAKKSPAEAEKAKLTLRLGDGEVELEAGRDTVREELDRVLDRLLDAAATAATGPLTIAVSAGAAATSAPPPAANAPAEPESALRYATRARGRQAVDPGAVKLLRKVTLEPERFADLYSVDPRGVVSLQRAPAKPLDAMYLLLYGALTLGGRSPLAAPALLEAAHASGLTLKRLPRRLGADRFQVVATGQRRGRRYQLTTAGVARAERLVRDLLEALPPSSPSPPPSRRDDDWAPW